VISISCDGNKQWMLTAYTLIFGACCCSAVGSRDYLGRRRIFIIGWSLRGASALAGLAQTVRNSSPVAPAGRVAAAVAPAALSLLSVTFTEPGERAKAFVCSRAFRGRRRTRSDRGRRAHRVRVLALVPDGEHPDRAHRIARALAFVLKDVPTAAHRRPTTCPVRSR